MKKIAFFLFAFFSLLNSYAQDQNLKRPKVGLVLSGGGAKGFAHIGVLRVLEQAGVKVDYIGGTSMGAVVGGLYASGYSANQIDSIFKATNFDQLLNDFIPRSSKNFYEKRHDETYAFTLPFKKLKIGIPTALSKGMYNFNLLNKLTYKVRHITDFNQLPIPFLCIATDIESGEEIVLNKGYLPQAMLASSAFPTLFSPVELDGKLLVDGGVTNNFPVEEIKKLGADIIIGVDVQDDLKDRKSLRDATRILVQISNLQMIDKMKEKIDLTDIYIKPDISDFSVISFDQGQAIIKKGEEAAFAQYEKIKTFGDSIHRGNVKEVFMVKADTLKINKIFINPLKNYTRAYVMGKLRFKPNSSITYNDIKLGTNNITATQNFSSVDYKLVKNGDRDNFVLSLTENPTKTFLKFSAHYDDLFKTSILMNITQKKTIFRNDVTSFDLIIGDNFRYNLDYYIDNGFYWSFGLKSKLQRFNRNVAANFKSRLLNDKFITNKANIDFSDLTNQIYLQTIFIQKFLIGAGVEYKNLRINSNTVETTNSQFENNNYGSLFGYIKYDALDNKYFPKKGWYFFGDFQSYIYASNANENFNRYSIVKGDFGFAQTIYDKTTVKLETAAGFSIGEQGIPFFDFILGGYGFDPIINFKPFYGYDFLGLSGDSYIKTAITLDYEIFKKNHINLSANYANIQDNLFDNSKWLSKVNHSGYAAGYGLESFIGPIEFKYSWSPEEKKGFAWFSVGFWF